MRDQLLIARRHQFAVIALITGVGLLGWIPTGSSASTSAPALVSNLRVAPERNAGYERDRFADWFDADSNDCDTRQEVLLRQNEKSRGACDDDRGSWFSAYDGVGVVVASELDVDHFVPLAEAWGSGARDWTSLKRKAYSNDLYRRSLIAVTASSNRSKGDSDPSEWLPPRSGYRCRYLANWVGVKYRWRLTLDKREKRTIKSVMSSCPTRSLLLGEIARISDEPRRRPPVEVGNHNSLLKHSHLWGRK